MDIGLVGLGKMGGNMRTRLRNAGHTVVGYDRNAEVSDVESLEELVGKLPTPRVVWVMVPAGDATRETVRTLGELLEEGDLVVDGGNSRWTDDQVHGDHLAGKGVGFVDCGVSGGVWGLENGYALMYGGSDDDVAKVQPAFDALKPEGEFGAVHAGGVGAGHFSKMVHNDLLVAALDQDPGLGGISGYAEDSGEGRWTVEAGIDNAVATPAITAALYARFVSRQDDSPAMKAVAAMRNQFGGHAMRTGAPEGGDVAGDGGPDQSGAAKQAGSGNDSEPAES